MGVRPLPDRIREPGDCWTGSVVWTVTRLRDVQRVTVEHVDCEPGEQLLVRLFQITAPRHPGAYPITATLEDATGGEAQVLPLRVHPQPRTKLSVSVPRTVQWREPTTLVVRALRPDGRIDRSYRGGVGLLSEEGRGCAFDGAYGEQVFDFTPADAGVREIPVRFDESITRIVARDVGRLARPDRSIRFEVQGDPHDVVICPISFH